jgi:hypothetical protein
METETLVQMKISGAENLKMFASVLHYMKVIDKDLKIEATPNSLIFRALNGPKTAYSSVEFSADFFDHGTYEMGERDGNFSCKVGGKYLCAITKSFKTCNTLSFRAEVTEGRYELVCELQSPNQIKRKHRFRYEDNEVLSAAFDETGASYLLSQHKVLTKAFTHLHASPEIIVTATESRFKMRSYHALGADTSIKYLETDVDIDTENNFDEYEFKVDDDYQEHEENEEPKRQFICCVREMKALLHLSEMLGIQCVGMHFFDQGKPLKLNVSSDVLSAILVMTTIDKPAPVDPAAAKAAAPASSQQSNRVSSKSGSKKASSSSSSSSKARASSSQASSMMTLSQGQELEETKASSPAPPPLGEEPQTTKTHVVRKGHRGSKPSPQLKPAPYKGLLPSDNEDGDGDGEDDEDEDGPIGRGRRTSGAGVQARRVVLDDEEEEEEGGDGGNNGTQHSGPASTSASVGEGSHGGKKPTVRLLDSDSD